MSSLFAGILKVDISIPLLGWEKKHRSLTAQANQAVILTVLVLLLGWRSGIIR
jgi:hypothetical protein